VFLGNATAFLGALLLIVFVAHTPRLAANLEPTSEPGGREPSTPRIANRERYGAQLQHLPRAGVHFLGRLKKKYWLFSLTETSPHPDQSPPISVTPS
jgi:hypothetical protein